MSSKLLVHYFLHFLSHTFQAIDNSCITISDNGGGYTQVILPYRENIGMEQLQFSTEITVSSNYRQARQVHEEE